MTPIRRNLLQVLAGGVALSAVTDAIAASTRTIALLHLAPRPGEIAANRHSIEQGARQAAARDARLVVTPELAVSGYGFRDLIGTGWIAEGQADLFAWAGALARDIGATLVLGTPEATSDALFNSMIVFAPDGRLTGRHRKINALRVGSESWSTPGDRPTVIAVDGIGRVGFFVCADMYSPRLVDETFSFRRPPGRPASTVRAANGSAPPRPRAGLSSSATARDATRWTSMPPVRSPR